MAKAASLPVSAGSGHRARVYTLGRFQVCLQDKPLHFAVRSHRKPLELLKVLIALGGEQVAEELLCDALWPDAEGDQARSTLGSTLHRLRRLVGSESLELRDRRLTLNAECCWVDARAFVEALERATQSAGANDDGSAWAHLEQALALYRGPFLEGEFEPPAILPTRERLHGLFLRNLREWGGRYAAEGHPERAAVLYRRGLEADALAEELYQALMRLQLEQGQVAEGIATYRRCRELLQSSAGIAPSRETEQLHEALLAGRKAVTARAASRRPQEAADASEQAAPLLPEQPSIAVLAFDNLSGDPEQEYFTDGISENIITRLAGIPDLSVIARSSSFAYKGKATDVRQVGSELGARYVLEGSVLRADQRIRVTAQLIDTISGKHLWAERFDREMQDLFAVLDEITARVVTQLEAQLTMGEHARVIAYGTDNVEALEHLLRARALLLRAERESSQRARDLSRKATELDPGFAWAYALEGWTHVQDVMYAWSTDRADSVRQAETLAHRALAADAANQFASSLRVRVHALKGEYDEAIALGRRVMARSPNDTYPPSLLANLLLWAGQPQEGLALISHALRLQPYPDVFQFNIAGDAHYFLGRYEDAIPWYRKVLGRQQRGADALMAWLFLIASHVELGQMEEARAEVRKLLQAQPDYSIAAAARLVRAAPFKEHTFLDRQLAGLRKAGLPD